jgi:hypothetical protein
MTPILSTNTRAQGLKAFLIAAALSACCGATAAPAGDVARLTGTAEQPTAGLAAPVASAETPSDDDTGELEVLAEGPEHRWFSTGVSVTQIFSDNVALLVSGTGGDISILGFRAGVHVPAFAVLDGRLDTALHYDYGAYAYGLLSGRRNDPVDGTMHKFSDLDFQTHSLTQESRWSRGGWSAAASVRGTIYVGTRSGDREYAEMVPQLTAGYASDVFGEDRAGLDVGADYRLTHTRLEPLAAELAGEDMNDRMNLFVRAHYTKMLGAEWYVQPSYTLNFANYTEGGSTPLAPGAGAQSWTHQTRLTLGYLPCEMAHLRVFIGFDRRESDERLFPDYKALSGGAGADLTFRF